MPVTMEQLVLNTFSTPWATPYVLRYPPSAHEQNNLRYLNYIGGLVLTSGVSKLTQLQSNVDIAQMFHYDLKGHSVSWFGNESRFLLLPILQPLSSENKLVAWIPCSLGGEFKLLEATIYEKLYIGMIIILRSISREAKFDITCSSP